MSSTILPACSEKKKKKKSGSVIFGTGWISWSSVPSKPRTWRLFLPGLWMLRKKILLTSNF